MLILAKSISILKSNNIHNHINIDIVIENKGILIDCYIKFIFKFTLF